jgi:hypothetical protein
VNKAYVDTPDKDKSNASLIYIPNNGEMFYNLLSTKFPIDSTDSIDNGEWYEVYTDGVSLKDKFVVFFSDLYSYKHLTDDLSLLDYNTVELPISIVTLNEMITYIEENNL